MALAVQVLKALNRPGTADQAKHLRQAADHLHADHDASRWLGSGLVPQVLAILHSLPSGRSPKEAIEVCTAATAVLSNLLLGLDTPEQLHQFHALLRADQAAFAALVHWGIVRPEASEQLPPARRPKLLAGFTVPEAATANVGHPFWTPFTTSCSFLVALNIVMHSMGSPTTPYISWILLGNLGAAMPGVIAHALRVAIQHPCSTPLCSRVHDRCVRLSAQLFAHAWLCAPLHAC
jgi:hypothetical protein